MNANEQQREIDRLGRELRLLELQQANLRARIAAASLLLRMAHEEHDRAQRPDTTRKE